MPLLSQATTWAPAGGMPTASQPYGGRMSPSHPADAHGTLPKPREPAGHSQQVGCLDAGGCRAGWYSRRAGASAERGRVQGPGRAEADLGPRTVTVEHYSLTYSWAPWEHQCRNCLVRLLAPGSVPQSLP
jgi:hypothetical protein